GEAQRLGGGGGRGRVAPHGDGLRSLVAARRAIRAARHDRRGSRPEPGARGNEDAPLPAPPLCRGDGGGAAAPWQGPAQVVARAALLGLVHVNHRRSCASSTTSASPARTPSEASSSASTS